MKWERTNHRDGSVSIKFIPEEGEQKAFSDIFGRAPGGLPRETGIAYAYRGALTKDGIDWDNGFKLGDERLMNPMGWPNTRLVIGYPQDVAPIKEG